MESTSSFLGELTGSVLGRQECHCVTAVLWCRCNWHALIETTHTSRRRQCDCNNNRYPMTDLATLDIDRAKPRHETDILVACMCMGIVNSKSHRGHVLARFHLGMDSSTGDRLDTKACVCTVVWKVVFMLGFVAIGLAVLA